MKQKVLIIHGKGVSNFYTLQVFGKQYPNAHVWKLNNHGGFPIPDQHWEIHDPIHYTDEQIIREYYRSTGLWLKGRDDFKIIRRCDIHIEKLKEVFGIYHFSNTICYQLAQAIYNRYDVICMSGCDKYAITEVKEVDGVKLWIKKALDVGIEVKTTHLSEIDLSNLKTNKIINFEYN